mmetsp:Transcript_7113/g.12223  ORF Transcript_7113/g.12223 Transcript_7113/m.12223 type:complete len:385 (-) Transcript_7113:847-2001(-)
MTGPAVGQLLERASRSSGIAWRPSQGTGHLASQWSTRIQTPHVAVAAMAKNAQGHRQAGTGTVPQHPSVSTAPPPPAPSGHSTPATSAHVPVENSHTGPHPSSSGSSSSSEEVIDILPVEALVPELGSQGTQGTGDTVEGTGGGSGGPIVAAISLLGVAFLLGGGFLFKDQIKTSLEWFITVIDDYGPWGYVAYFTLYVLLEVLALPAVPLTMTAGAIFGSSQGTALVSVAGTLAATIAFLIARYLARDKVRAFAYKKVPRFQAIDRAIGRDGLKFVTLLRLSPLLPLAASNYLYGLTSVDLGSYVLGSWIGMLPGTYAYVHAGAVGRAFMEGNTGEFSVETWQVGVGLAATVLALAFVGRLAQAAIEEEGATAAGETKSDDKQ